MAEPRTSPCCGLVAHLVFPQHLRKQDENLLSDGVRTHSLLEAPSHT